MRYLIVFSFILFVQCKTAQQQPPNNNDTLLSGTTWKLLSVASIVGRESIDTAGIAYYYIFKADSIYIRINEDIIRGVYSTNQYRQFTRFYLPISLHQNVSNNTILRKYPVSAIDINRLNDNVTSYNIYGDTLILFSTNSINQVKYYRFLKREDW